MDLSTAVLAAFVTAVVGLVIWQVVRSVRNPVVNVADAFTVTVPFADADAEVAAVLAMSRRVDLRMVLPGTYTLSYKHVDGLVALLGIITFPIGLLILFFGQKTLMLTISVTGDEDRTRVQVVGRVHKTLATSVGQALQRRLTRIAARA